MGWSPSKKNRGATVNTHRNPGRVKILSTVEGYQWPGSEYLWADAAELLLSRKHSVTSYLSEDFRGAGKLLSLQRRGLAVRFLSKANNFWKRRFRDYSGPAFRWDANADLLVISCGSLFDICFSPGLATSLKKTTVPYAIVCQFNADTFWFDNAMRDEMRDIYRNSVASVFISKQNLELAERQLAASLPNTTIITNPVWIPEPPIHVTWPNFDNETCQMACVARLDTRWKGQDVLFDVLRSDKWMERNWHLSLFGEGPEESYLRQLAVHYGIEQRVTFKGVVSDIAEIWDEHHLQVLATRAEGGPMVITEGMYCGRPAVTTSCGHIPEFIDDNVNGFLADFATTKCFAEAMDRAWNARSRWQEIGVLAQQSASRIQDQGQKLGNLLLTQLASATQAD